MGVTVWLSKMELTRKKLHTWRRKGRRWCQCWVLGQHLSLHRSGELLLVSCYIYNEHKFKLCNYIIVTITSHTLFSLHQRLPQSWWRQGLPPPPSLQKHTPSAPYWTWRTPAMDKSKGHLQQSWVQLAFSVTLLRGKGKELYFAKDVVHPWLRSPQNSHLIGVVSNTIGLCDPFQWPAENVLADVLVI